MKSGTKKIMIVAGENSGDGHAAKLVRAMRAAAPDTEFEFFGAVSHQMRDAGVEEVVNADDFSIVGLPEIARALPMFWRDFKILRKAATDRRPDAVILVDFPEFNLKLAKSLKKAGLRVIYYISPQIWAWRKYRVSTIRKYVDLVLTILPFEKAWYEQQGISHVEFVGNPTVREIRATQSRAEFCAANHLDAARPVVTLLPGSRHKEIVRILPVLLDTACLMASRDPTIQFVIALAANRKMSEVDEALELIGRSGRALPVTFRVVQEQTHNALAASDAAAVTSGTATLETACLGTPLAIVYKTSVVNYKLMRPLISVEHFGLINLIAGERLAAEMIQDDFTPSALAEELFRLMDPEVNQDVRRRLNEATAKLGQGGASKNAANAILRVIAKSDL